LLTIGKTTGIAPGCHLHAVKVLDSKTRSGTGKYGDSVFHGLDQVFKDFKEVRRLLFVTPCRFVDLEKL
jgi:hypothetical protein